jgi:putative ABC transport system permease protein
MYERIKEIGTMRALGVQRKEIKSLFLNEALFLAIGGAVSGIVLALIASPCFPYRLRMNTPAFMIMKNGHLSFFGPPYDGFQRVIIAILTLLAAYLRLRPRQRWNPPSP